MEANSTQKRLFSMRGRWSVRMDSELLDYVQHFNYPWEMVAEKLGFSIDECKQRYDYLLHPELFENKNANALQTKKSVKQEKQRKEGEEKKKHRSVRKSSSVHHPVAVMDPFHPPMYNSWDSTQQKMWDQIPFDANSYYLHYLPPGVSPRNCEWSEEETRSLLSAVKAYPPHEKWGLFSLHFLGRTGEECERRFRECQSREDAELKKEVVLQVAAKPEVIESACVKESQEEMAIVDKEDERDQFQPQGSVASDLCLDHPSDGTEVEVGVEKDASLEERVVEKPTEKEEMMEKEVIEPQQDVREEQGEMEKEVIEGVTEKEVIEGATEKEMIEEPTEQKAIEEPMKEEAVEEPMKEEVMEKETIEEPTKEAIEGVMEKEVIEEPMKEEVMEKETIEEPIEKEEEEPTEQKAIEVIMEKETIEPLKDLKEGQREMEWSEDGERKEEGMTEPMEKEVPEPPKEITEEHTKKEAVPQLPEERHEASPSSHAPQDEIPVKKMLEMEKQLFLSEELRVLTSLLPDDDDTDESWSEEPSKTPATRSKTKAHKPVILGVYVEEPEVVSTPPRVSKKREVVENESPLITPSKQVSVASDLVTPVRTHQREKVQEASPTKVTSECFVVGNSLPETPAEQSFFRLLEEKSSSYPVAVRRLLKEIGEERRRFDVLMQRQTSQFQAAYFSARSKWSAREMVGKQREYRDQYKRLCRTLQAEYNSMVTCEVTRLAYYGVAVKKEDMYNLRFPTIRFSAGLFLCVCWRVDA